MKRRSWLWILLICMLVMSVSVGFAAKKSGVDTSKPVKLSFYLLGNAPVGMTEVVAQLNKKMKRDINATIEFNYIGWGDLQSKYPLVLAAGEDVDLIFTANWCYYMQEAAKGAFLEIKQDMLKKYMPKHFKATAPEAWKQARIDGKVYMIPTSTPDRKVQCAIIRGDLRKKYGVPEVKRFSDLEPYFAAIRKNEPEMMPMSLDSNYDLPAPMMSLYMENSANWRDLFETQSGGSGIRYDLEDPNAKLYLITEAKVLPAMKKAAAVMKSWYEKGYLNKDVFANKVRSKDAFNEGKSALGFGNSMDIQSNLAVAKSKGWQVEILPRLTPSGHSGADPFIGNAVGIAARSKNPERAMMALDLMMEDPGYNYLVYFGIRGKNYIINNGKVDLPKGLTADKNTYPPDAAGFWFTNKDQFKPLATWDDQYVQLRSSMKKWLVQDRLITFAPDTEPIKTEIASLNQTYIQYFNPIAIGAVKDIDDAFATLDQRLKAAGAERALAEMKKQTQAYLESQK